MADTQAERFLAFIIETVALWPIDQAKGKSALLKAVLLLGGFVWFWVVMIVTFPLLFVAMLIVFWQDLNC
jgi:hypothetical protein